MIRQISFQLPPKSRGYHLITADVSRQIGELPDTGLLFLFIQHTSAGITINENADPSVRVDFESIFNQLIPENLPFLTHTFEGPDDMPAHIKASLVGSSITIPISNGKLNLGIWQGVYLCEFRNHAGGRQFVASIYS